MILFLYGEDTYRSRRKSREFKEKFLKEVDPSGLNLTYLPGGNLDLENFAKTALAPAFLAKKRMIIIEDLLSGNKNKSFKKDLLDLLLEKNQKIDNILLFYESQKIASKDKLFAFLSGQRYAQEFSPLSGAELARWLRNEALSRGAKIETKAVDLLISFLGNDLWQLDAEIDKLIAYKFISHPEKTQPNVLDLTPAVKQEAGFNSREIISSGKSEVLVTAEDIKMLVKGKINEDIFALTDALGKKDKKQALYLLHNQLVSGIDPLHLLSMITWQFRILLLTKDLIQNQPQARIGGRLNIHPYVAQKAILACKNFELAELKQIYQELLGIDMKIKTGSDPVLAFDLFVCKIR